MSSVRSGILVASLVFVSAMVLFTEHASAPFYYHQDEPGKVLQVIHRRKNFHHPLLMLTTAEVARKAFLHGGAEDDPQRVVEMARTIMAAFAAASRAAEPTLIDGSADIVEIEVLGDWAWLRTHIEVTVSPPGGPPKTRSGYTLTILRKEPDGKWRLVRDANLLA